MFWLGFDKVIVSAYSILRPERGEKRGSFRAKSTSRCLIELKLVYSYVIEVPDSESVFSLHENALVSEICAFYLNKSDIHFIISSNSSAKSRLIEDIC